MKIERFDGEGGDLWKEFIEKTPETKLQHSLEFRDLIKETYKNCEDFYFLLKDEEDIKAVFPFFLVKSIIFGNRLISLPFIDVGGFYGDYNYEELKELIDEIKKIKNLRHIEIRINDSMKDFDNLKDMLIKLRFKEESSKQQFIIKLTSEEDMWKRFDKYTRKGIKKTEREGLRIKKIEDKAELKRFYKIYLKEMKNFGTPQHSFKFFKNILSKMKDNFLGLNCYYKEKIIGSLIMLYYHKYGYVAFNVSDLNFRKYRPNDLLYWETIKWAINNKLKLIDMGQTEKKAKERTHANGLYNFKKKWLGDLYNRSYFYYSFGGGSGLETEEMDRKKNKLKSYRKIWQKLPLSGIRMIGPKICSELGI